VITHPDYEKDDDSGLASSKRRKLIVAMVLTAGAALFAVNFMTPPLVTWILPEPYA